MKLENNFLFITIYVWSIKDKTCNIVIKVYINFTNVKDLIRFNKLKKDLLYKFNLIWNMVSNFFIHIHHLKKKSKRFFYFF